MTTFISSTIPYVNAKPHLGFAYELVLADILARHRRRRGKRVRFVSGTDDHSLKNVRAAAKAGVTPRELVERNAAAFVELGPLLDVRVDDFVRTSSDPRHRASVDALWLACESDLYRASWSGRYCVGCEAFVDDDVVVCDEHGVEPERISEDNWFFRLSRYRDAIREAIESNRVQIVPESARNETLAFLAGDVRDLSVSRDATRAADWGIRVPNDPGQVIYVWFDALANYIAHGDAWQHATERTHVLGKGVTRFHAVYWLAFLLAAKLPLPHRIFVHGYLTVDGKKIGKSTNPVDVPPFVDACGVDALRWFYARQCRTRTDTDVTRAAILAAHDRDLSDRLGNLVQRTIAVAHKLSSGRVIESIETEHVAELRAIARALPARVDAALDAFALDEAAAAIIELVDAANRYVDVVAPWRHATSAALYAPLEAARIAAAELAPFVPSISQTILARLGGNDTAAWGGLAIGTQLVAGPPPVPKR
jgi:methionyl-tRNA synthetase